MYDKFKENIDKYDLVRAGDTVIIGVSGGYDSMGLLLCFLKLQEEIDIKLAVCHVNHMVRGKEADEDEAFVRALAEERGLEFHAHRQDMAGFARTHKISEEDAGRKIRYGFFHEVARLYNASLIATGHNRPDQAETLIMNLIRGTGPRGLRGMDFKTGKIIRPILNISREEIEDFVDASGLGHRDDRTNFESDYRRNSIRNELIPLIEEKYNPNFQDSLYRLSLLVREDLDLIEDLIKEDLDRLCTKVREDGFIIDKPGFEALARPRQRHLIRYMIEQIRGTLSGFESSHIEDLLTTALRPTGRRKVIKSIALYNEYDKIRLVRENQRKDMQGMTKLIKNKVFTYGTYKIGFELCPQRTSYKGSKNTQYFCADGLEEIVIRPRKAGDRVDIFGLGGSKKLKDLFIDEKIPQEKRDLIPIFAIGDQIIWVGGVRRSSHYLVKADCEKILKITLEEI